MYQIHHIWGVTLAFLNLFGSVAYLQLPEEYHHSRQVKLEKRERAGAQASNKKRRKQPPITSKFSNSIGDKKKLVDAFWGKCVFEKDNRVKWYKLTRKPGTIYAKRISHSCIVFLVNNCKNSEITKQTKNGRYCSSDGSLKKMHSFSVKDKRLASILNVMIFVTENSGIRVVL